MHGITSCWMSFRKRSLMCLVCVVLWTDVLSVAMRVNVKTFEVWASSNILIWFDIFQDQKTPSIIRLYEMQIYKNILVDTILKKKVEWLLTQHNS